MDQDQDADRTARRTEALDRYAILDTQPERAFDDIVLLASRLCETPVALVSLVAESRQWFKARIGFPTGETPIGQSVCAHALLEDEILVIPDLTLDARTRHNTLVTEDPFIRFYAGAVIQTPDGVPLGSLCVIDTKPRPEGLSPSQAESLQALARQVMSELELRRILAETRTADAAFKRQQTMLKAELSHRLKNVLTIVQAVILQTLRRAASLDEARRVLSDRIAALGKAQDILSDSPRDSADLSTIVRNVIDLLDDTLAGRLVLRGPETEIGAGAALPLTLMVHELATNALKYGALSSPLGRIAVEWSVEPSPEGPRFSLWWREHGGPAVLPPTRKGFGTRLIERSLAGEIGASITLDYAPAGLQCHLGAPLSGLSG